MNALQNIKLGDHIGFHVLVGHYSDLKSAFCGGDTRSFAKAKYVGRGTTAYGDVWHLFRAGPVSFACRDYTRKSKAFAYITEQEGGK